ncbi:MAG: ABC transporter substrate-binding protein [Gallionellaceae bacterium]
MRYFCGYIVKSTLTLDHKKGAQFASSSQLSRKNSWGFSTVSACIVLAIVGGLSACSKPSPELVREARTSLYLKNYAEGKDISLALVWNGRTKQFRDGAILAAEEINNEGGVAGHHLNLELIDASPFLMSKSFALSTAEGQYRNAKQEIGRKIAQLVIDNPNIAAVIGSAMPSETTLSAMMSFQNNGILFINAGSTDSRIMWASKDMYFQLAPQDEALVAKLVAETHDQKWRSVYIIYEDSRHKSEVVDLLRTELSNSDVRLRGTYAIPSDGSNEIIHRHRLHELLATFRNADIDAILLLTQAELGANIINWSRSINVMQPFMGTSELAASSKFIQTVGDAGVGTRITSLYRSNNYLVEQFEERFKQRFPEQEINEATAMGYDSVRLYADSVASAATTNPFRVIDALHFRLPIWYGLLGTYSFVDRHSKNLKHSIRQLEHGKNGTLEFVPENDSQNVSENVPGNDSQNVTNCNSQDL